MLRHPLRIETMIPSEPPSESNTQSQVPPPTTWEVEQKYRVEDLAAVRAGLQLLNARFLHQETHVDCYWRHPSRDFAQSDEAFRLRRIENQSFVTYKGPRLPGPVKTRPEIEVPLADETESSWRSILTHLGFTIASEVHKTREVYQLQFEGHHTSILLDSPKHLGSFVEIEMLTTDLAQRERVALSIQRLASLLHLSQVERRSYLSLWLQYQGLESHPPASETP